MHLSVNPSIHPPTHPLIHLPTNPPTFPPIYLPTHPNTHPPTYPPIHLPTHPLTHPPIHLLTHPPTHPPTHPSTYLHTHPPTYTPIHLPTHPSTYPPIHLSIHLPIHPPTHPSPTHPPTYPLTHLPQALWNVFNILNLPLLIAVLPRTTQKVARARKKKLKEEMKSLCQINHLKMKASLRILKISRPFERPRQVRRKNKTKTALWMSTTTMVISNGVIYIWNTLS